MGTYSRALHPDTQIPARAATLILRMASHTRSLATLGLGRLDPRLLQVAFLSLLLLQVTLGTSFGPSAAQLAATLVAALLTQQALIHGLGLSDPGPLSPLVSSLSLCLLLRTELPILAAAAAVLAIASKFLLRARGKHLFNPTNFGLLAVVLASDRAWVANGQWGSTALLAGFLAALGLTVTGRVGRRDISLGFLAAWAGLNLARVLWLGERPEVWGHRLLDGSLLVFAFFMISDPRPTPDTRRGRLLFAALVAAVAYPLRFELYLTAAPLWALLIVSPLTPLLDRLWPAARFEWKTKEVPDASPLPLAASSPPAR